MISVLVLLLAAFLAAASVWRQRRILTYLACVGVLFDGGWLLLTLLSRTALVGWSSSSVYLIGSVMMLGLAGWLAWKRGWHWPYKEAGSGVRDLMVLLVLVPVVGAGWLVWRFNGVQEDSSIVWHGFFNGDTVTFLSLVKRAGLEPGLVLGNPFSGLGALEYPTLLHAGWADFLMELGLSSGALLHYLPLITFSQVLLTIPLFWLLWDAVLPEPQDTRERWLGVSKRWIIYFVQTAIVAWVIALSWDNFVYPQSHFFLTGQFLAVTSLWLMSGRSRSKDWYVYMMPGLALTIVLMLSNAVTGTAAMIVALAALGSRVVERAAAITERQVSLVMILALVAVFLIATPGEPAFGMLNFSYSAAFDVARLTAPVLLVLAVMLWSERVVAPLPAMVFGLLAAAIGVFLFSSRNIVVENSSRFLYHLLLVSFPVLGAAIVRLWYWLRQKLWFESRPWAERWSLVGSVLSMAFLLVVPGLQSMASAHDNLQFKDERVISLPERELLWWMEENVPQGAVIVANPAENRWIHVPALTGRVLLRADYWLSADDAVHADLMAAFVGDEAAREQVILMGDYLLLTKEEQNEWGPVLGAKVFENNVGVLYEL